MQIKVKKRNYERKILKNDLYEEKDINQQLLCQNAIKKRFTITFFDQKRIMSKVSYRYQKRKFRYL
jgi:hypothetical protein